MLVPRFVDEAVQPASGSVGRDQAIPGIIGFRLGQPLKEFRPLLLGQALHGLDDLRNGAHAHTLRHRRLLSDGISARGESNAAAAAARILATCALLTGGIALLLL